MLDFFKYHQSKSTGGADDKTIAFMIKISGVLGDKSQIPGDQVCGAESQ